MTLSLNWCFQERVLKLGHNINKNVAPGGVFRKRDEKLVLVHKLDTYTGVSVSVLWTAIMYYKKLRSKIITSDSLCLPLMFFK